MASVKANMNDVVKNNNKQEFIKCKIDKKLVVGESEKAILVRLESVKELGVWFNKKFVFTSPYTNTLTISISADWEYRIQDLINRSVISDNAKYDIILKTFVF